MRKISTLLLSMLLVLSLAIPAYADELPEASGEPTVHEHIYSDSWELVQEPTCTATGIEERYCDDEDCPNIEESRQTRTVATTAHQWSGWSPAAYATVFAPGQNIHYCTVCGASEMTSTAKLAPYISWASKVSKVPRKSKVAFSVNLANGDYVKKWKSSKPKVASVSASGVVKGKKKGKTKITAYTASGLKISCNVKVVKPVKKKKASKKKAASGGKVYWTPSGSVYHKSRSCPTLSRSRTVYSGSKSKSGKSRACKVCG